MKRNNIKMLLILFVAVAVFAVSCQEDKENLSGKATVTINMKGIGTGINNELSRSAADAKVQRRQTTFNGEAIIATLTEVATPTSRAAGEITPLPAGTEYTVKVYDGADLKDSHTFTQGVEDNYEFELEAGTYTFKTFAYGNAIATGADKDPLWWQDDITVTTGSNNLDILLAHKLTEIKVIFNAGATREIEAINDGGAQSTIAPNHEYVFNEESGVVTFNAVTAAANITFPTQAASSTWTSNPVMMAVENTDNGSVELKGVVIDGTPGEVTLDGWKLKAGVQYTLTLNLGDQVSTDLTYTVTVPAGTKKCYMKGGFLSMNNNWADFIELNKVNETIFTVDLPTFANETYRYFTEKSGEYIEVNADGSDRTDRTWNDNNGIDEVVKWKTVPAEPTTVTLKCLVPTTVSDLYIIGTFTVEWKADPFGEDEKMTYVGEEDGKKAFIYEYTTINPAALLFKFAAGPERAYLQSSSDNHTIANGTMYDTNKYSYEVLSFRDIYTTSSRTTNTQWGETDSQSGEAGNNYW